MAKAAVVNFPKPDYKLPKLDLDALFAAQKANLAVVHEAQTVLFGAAEAVAKVQHGYLEQVVADVKAAFASKQVPSVKAVQAAGEKATAVSKEAIDLTVAAQRRVFELFSARSQASVNELKALAA
jgi:hypothetical protein